MKIQSYLPLLSFAALITGADAVVVTLDSTDALDSSSFDTVGNWSPAIAPSMGNDYVVDGAVLRTPIGTGPHLFGGDSLTLRSQMSLKSPDGSTVTVGNLIMDGGFARNNTGSTTQTLGGNINILGGGGRLAGGNNVDRRLIVTSTITGIGALSLEANNDAGSYLRLVSSGTNTYSGGTSVTSGLVSVRVDNGLGTGNVSVDSGATLELTLASLGNYIGDSANLLLADSMAQVSLNFNGTDIVGGLSLDGGTTFLAPGIYGAVGNGLVDPGNEISNFTGNGLISVVPEPSSAILLVSGLLFGLTRRRR